MNLSNIGRSILSKWSLPLVLLSMTAVASAGGPPEKSEAKHSAPSKPQHSARARQSHPSGSGGRATQSPRPGGGAVGGGHATTPNRPSMGGGRTPGRSPQGEARQTQGGHTPAGTRNVSLRGGGSASIRSNGQIRSVDRNGMHIERGVNGGRTVIGQHNGARVVNTGRNSGYVQRPYLNRGGRAYYSRTYYSNGHYYTGVYRGYYWGGHTYYGYYPGVWYHPAFYGWGFRPWGAPVYWGVGLWGWGGAPWFGFYGGWFAPYPYYAAPAFWLTDYVIAAELQSAYSARADANAQMDAEAMASSGPSNGGDSAAPASGGATLTPEVKQAIADEVKAQLAEQQAQAQDNGSGGQASAAPAAAPAPANGEIPPALDPARRTFVVDSNLTVTVNGQECGLTGGDVLTRLTDTPDDNNMVNASVSASKKSDCAAGQTVAVKVDDLQEMQNHFAEQLNNGLGELAKKQGTDGMPKAPDTGTTPSDVPAPAPDTTAQKTLQDQQQAADQTEDMVKQETAGNGGTQ